MRCGNTRQPPRRTHEQKGIKPEKSEASSISSFEDHDGKSTDYQIDTVTERYFPQFLKMIEQEQAKTARRMNDNQGTIRRSADRILGKLRGIGEPGVVRYIMESQE